MVCVLAPRLFALDPGIDSDSSRRWRVNTRRSLNAASAAQMKATAAPLSRDEGVCRENKKQCSRQLQCEVPCQ